MPAKPGLLSVLLFLLLFAACAQPVTVALPVTAVAQPTMLSQATATAIEPTQPKPIPTDTPTPPPLPIPTVHAAETATPFFQGDPPPACGQLLPLFAAETAASTTSLTPDPDALSRLEAIIPTAALPALRQLLANPQTTGLAAYRAGQETNGVFLNADIPMPLASVVKIIHLVAYAEAVAAGQLDPLSTVPLSDLENYYLPRSDLGAHQRAVAELTENGRAFADPPHIVLDEVPWLMIRHSSNAATDYLHMLLGQEVIEQTAVSLGLTSQTAPCPFLGQFLAMSNHIRSNTNDRLALADYLADPAVYGQEVMVLTDAFASNAQFRADEIAWREEQRRSSSSIQEFFTAHLNAQGSARDYAALMARLAQNGLKSGESSFIARRFLEWPMRFPENQELFYNLGYKNGRLPGSLTTVYYAYPNGETTPLVIALFYRNLPNDLYRNWRNSLPHDEFARWLLSDPAALPALREVINES